jgi:hypothetical protein
LHDLDDLVLLAVDGGGRGGARGEVAATATHGSAGSSNARLSTTMVAGRQTWPSVDVPVGDVNAGKPRHPDHRSAPSISRIDASTHLATSPGCDCR